MRYPRRHNSREQAPTTSRGLAAAAPPHWLPTNSAATHATDRLVRKDHDPAHSWPMGLSWLPSDARSFQAGEIFQSQPGEDDMKKVNRQTMRIGDLVAKVFDHSARYSSNPREVSRLATRVIRQLLHTSQVDDTWSRTTQVEQGG